MTFVLAAAIVASLTVRVLFFHAETRQGRFGGRVARVVPLEARAASARPASDAASARRPAIQDPAS